MTFFQHELIGYMKELVKRADIITPNVTECCLLTGLSYDKLQSYQANEDYILAIEEAGAAVAVSYKREGHHYWLESTRQFGNKICRQYVYRRIPLVPQSSGI